MRILRLAWPYRWTYALSLVCALAGAVLFSGSLSAVFPLMKIIFAERSLQDWTAEKVAEQQSNVRDAEGEVARAEKGEAVRDPRGPAGEQRPGEARGDSNLTVLKLKLERQRLRLAWSIRAHGYLVRFVPRDRYQTLVLVLAVWMIGLALKGVLGFFNDTLVSSVSERAMRDLRNQFYRHTVRMDLSSFTEQGTSELLARFTKEAGVVGGGLETVLGKVVCEPIRALACLALACWLNWRVTLVVVGLVPLAVVSVGVMSRSLKKAARKSLGSMSSVYALLQETLQGIKIVKAFTMESYERRRFYEEANNFYRRSMKLARLEAATAPIMEMVGMGAVATALLAGAYLVITKQTHIFGVRMATSPMDPETLIVLYAFLAGVSDPLRKLSNVYGRIQRATAAAERIFVLMDRQPTVGNAPRAPRLGRHSEALELVDVSFSYPRSGPVLKNVNLRIAFGETVAIVGSNGSGKTTLANLVPRFYDPQEGRILIDGVDIRGVQLRSLRRQIGIVTQETLLFNDTILHNIAYGKRRARREQIEAAAKRAHADRFIEELPAAYETAVGERGMKLSGGERQRIALARAILRDPAILILDEATSSLDVESESLIHHVLREFMRDRTTLLITHRLSSLQLADRIVVMNDGEIVDVGGHEALLRRCPQYTRLHDISQAGRYLSAG